MTNTHNMEAAIQQQDNVIFTVIAILATAFLLFAGMAAINSDGFRTTVTEAATMQWSSDTSWTGGGWR